MRTEPFAHSPEFRRLIGGDPRADLTRIALEIAQDATPGLDIDDQLARIDALADRVRGRCPAGSRPRLVIGHINWVLFVEEGFHGDADSYYDARNSYLNHVLDRRTGIPISLSALYLAIADRVGLPMGGVNLPGHFIVRADEPGRPLFVDPFHEGALLDRDSCAERVEQVTGRPLSLSDDDLATCPTATIVARILRNLKAVYLSDGSFLDAVPVLRRLVAITEGDPIERRDLGAVCVHAGHPGEAAEHLAAYLDAHPSAADAEPVGDLLRLARREQAARN